MKLKDRRLELCRSTDNIRIARKRRPNLVCAGEDDWCVEKMKKSKSSDTRGSICFEDRYRFDGLCWRKFKKNNFRGGGRRNVAVGEGFSSWFHAPPAVAGFSPSEEGGERRGGICRVGARAIACCKGIDEEEEEDGEEGTARVRVLVGDYLEERWDWRDRSIW